MNYLYMLHLHVVVDQRSKTAFVTKDSNHICLLNDYVGDLKMYSRTSQLLSSKYTPNS